MVGRSNEIGLGLLLFCGFSIIVLAQEKDSPSVIAQDEINEIHRVNSHFDMCN